MKYNKSIFDLFSVGLLVILERYSDVRGTSSLKGVRKIPDFNIENIIGYFILKHESFFVTCGLCLRNIYVAVFFYVTHFISIISFLNSLFLFSF